MGETRGDGWYIVEEGERREKGKGKRKGGGMDYFRRGEREGKKKEREASWLGVWVKEYGFKHEFWRVFGLHGGVIGWRV
jgi:hypothetical protein